jgi:hypothetical protein
MRRGCANEGGLFGLLFFAIGGATESGRGNQRLVVVLPDGAAAAAAKFYLTSILGRCSGSLGLSSAGLGSRSFGGCWDGLLYNPSISNLLVCLMACRVSCRVVSCLSLWAWLPRDISLLLIGLSWAVVAVVLTRPSRSRQHPWLGLLFLP